MSASVQEIRDVKAVRDARKVSCGGPGTAVLTEIETAHVHEQVTFVVAGVSAVTDVRMGCTHWSFYVLAGVATCLLCGHQWNV